MDGTAEVRVSLQSDLLYERTFPEVTGVSNACVVPCKKLLRTAAEEAKGRQILQASVVFNAAAVVQHLAGMQQVCITG
jgi:hypothetical protein